MKHCMKFEEMISAYVDGELDSDDKLLLEEHLRSCPGCLNLLALYHGMSVSMQESCAQPPSSLRDNVMDVVKSPDSARIVTPSHPIEIDEEFEAREKKRKLKKTILTRYAPIAASVAIIATLVLPQFLNIDRSLGETAAAPLPVATREAAYDDTDDLAPFAAAAEPDAIAEEAEEEAFGEEFAAAETTQAAPMEAPADAPVPEDADEGNIEPYAPIEDIVGHRLPGGGWTLHDSLLDPEYLATFYAFIMVEHEFTEESFELIAYYSDYYLLEQSDVARFIEEFDNYIVFSISGDNSAQFALIQFVW